MLSYCESAPHPRAHLIKGESHVLQHSQFLDVKSIDGIATSVASVARLGEEDVANTVLSFVQNVGYVSNNYTRENTLYPVETLAHGGVCDDLSVLYASMMITVGFRVVFVAYPESTDIGGSRVGHVNVGVYLANPPEHMTEREYTCFTYNGLKYYVAETTGDGWRVGDLPKKLQGRKYYLEEAIAPVSTPLITKSTTATAPASTTTPTFTLGMSSVLLVLIGIAFGTVIGIVLSVRKRPLAPGAPIPSPAPSSEVTAPSPTEIKVCPHCGASLAGQKGEFCHNCWKKIK